MTDKTEQLTKCVVGGDDWALKAAEKAK